MLAARVARSTAHAEIDRARSFMRPYEQQLAGTDARHTNELFKLMRARQQGLDRQARQLRGIADLARRVWLGPPGSAAPCRPTVPLSDSWHEWRRRSCCDLQRRALCLQHRARDDVNRVLRSPSAFSSPNTRNVMFACGVVHDQGRPRIAMDLASAH
jgi:hypothetical protein